MLPEDMVKRSMLMSAVVDKDTPEVSLIRHGREAMILTEKMTDEKAKEITQLATDVLTMTLHGPLPMETVAKLAQGILDLGAEREDREREIERLESQVERLESRVDEPCEDCSTARAETAESENAALKEQIERLEATSRRWRAMFEHAAQLIADEIEAYGLAGDEATEEIEKWYAAILSKKASE